MKFYIVFKVNNAPKTLSEIFLLTIVNLFAKILVFNFCLKSGMSLKTLYYYNIYFTSNRQN